ncbi:glycoside hydrolase family 3 C-terminal domain-containing protein [Microbacterium sp. kSW2-24]|uniref:glycoside hydrolase family 3 N-terminal domain-containing protein n=1 Tax=Microbacterium galbinum TaxID=2851646 RepID=UPI001FFD5AE9|nr:glycoside hydrolase family 3 N-terminal domain-containing protein [Microbacterium galbinum]MCK2022674.1 glycoside hydrolase family 3 C-terminal domain-containing protein [Microbacterium galbinum]
MITAPKYRDPSCSVVDRVEDLLARMSPEEKAGQLTQFFYFGGLGEVPNELDLESLPPEQQAFIRQPAMVEAAIAAGGAGSVLFVTDPAIANRLQRSAVEQSPHGIPLLFAFDVIHGLRTIFPVPIAQAASWDASIIEAAQAASAREARAVGIHWTFAPMVDVARDPRWGRIVESAGEDPYLSAVVAGAQVRGFQGNRQKENVLAGPKHFAGYGAGRGGRDYDDAEISEAELRNIYFPPFKAAIEAGAATIMSAYMDLNGVPASGNAWLLNDVLRDEMGFKGVVVSDANAVKSLQTQHFAATATDAATRALTAGLDMEMCMFDPAFATLPVALGQGLFDEQTLDAAVRRVLTAKFDFGLFEDPFVDESRADEILVDADHRELARIVAERSAVLLANDGTLPLDRSALKTVAVVGQLAASRRDTLGPWVFDHDTEDTVSILDGLRSSLEGDADIVYEPGASVPARVFPSMFDRQDPTVENTPSGYDDDEAIDRAEGAVASADVAIVVVGERQNQIGENASRSTLELPGRQLEQLQRLVATGTPVVLLVMSGRPLDLRWANDHVSAILQVWYPGSRGGEAVAALVFGEVSPAGRLPFSWPRHVGHVPMVYSHQRTFEPHNQSRRYWDEESTPLYPFGHGLSYGSFVYGALSIERSRLGIGETVRVSVDVTNTSRRLADEVVQLYIHQRHGRASRPIRELKGFERITLPAGGTRRVSFRLGPDELRYWSSATREWVQDPTILDIGVGGSSAVALAESIEIYETHNEGEPQ